MTVDVAVLGPLRVQVGSESLHLGGPKPRGVLALLLLEHGRIVAADALVERLWGQAAAGRPAATLQVHVSNLRKSLAPLAEALGLDEVILTRGPGYLVELPAEVLDLTRFERLVADGRAAGAEGRTAAAADLFAAASQLVGGDPLADLCQEPWWDEAVRPVTRQIRAVMAEGLRLGLDSGRHAELLPRLEQLVRDDPLDEGLRCMLMLALYRNGRQAAALAAYQEGREALVEELGVDPGPDLRSLEEQILRHDPALDLSSRPAAELELSTALRSSLLVGAAELVLGEHRVPIEGAVTTIGRRGTQDLVVDDTRASRAHAVVRSSGGRHVLEDLGSTNGTELNGEPVHGPTTLVDGDRIRIGDTEILYATTP